MKTVINIVLAACVIGLIYVCYGSIMGPINFDDAKKTREKQVIARLIDIRKASWNTVTCTMDDILQASTP